jgi:hypothetical protein
VCQGRLNYGVIILELSISQPIVSFMLYQSILKFDFHFVRERVARKLMDIGYISTKDQIADGFTKPLPVRQLEMFKNNLNLVCSD